MKKSIFFLSISITLSLFSCENRSPNINKKGKDELKSLEVERDLDKGKMNYKDTLYIPVYSDIYVDEQNQKTLLAATLSIRNTSHEDSLFISKIDYYNTEGLLVRSFLNKMISLPPMGTINYVIEKEDDTGGNGANFIVALSSKNEAIRPLVQAVMIGQMGNKGFAFLTDGYSIKNTNNSDKGPKSRGLKTK